MDPRLLVISTGDWDSAIVRRNAWGRLEASVARGVFHHVHYAFFRVEQGRSFQPEPWITVHEVSGVEGAAAGAVAKLRAFVAGARQLDALVREYRPAAIQVVDPFQSGVLGLWLARRHGIPLAVNLVSHYRLSWGVAGQRPVGGIPPWLAFRLQDHVLTHADLVNTDRAFYSAYARSCGAPAHRIREHPMWVERSFFDLEPDTGVLGRYGVGDPHPLVYIGRLSPEKYSDDLIRAFVRVRETFPGKELVVMGGAGPLRAEVEAMAREAGAGEALHILRGTAEEVAGFVKAASVVLAPHAGYSLLESAITGAAVVAYDFEWHPELVRDGVTGRLVPYRDWEAMAQATVGLLRHPGRRDAYADALQSLALELHQPHRVVDSMNRAMAELIGSPGP